MRMRGSNGPGRPGGRATLAAMGTAAHRATPGGRRLAALVVAALAVAIGACGEDEPMANIPPEDASAMVDLLDQVRATVDAGDCGTAAAAVDEYIALVNLLQADDVETEVKESMRAAGFKLEELINEQCGEAAAATEAPEEEVAPPEETTPEETATEEPPEEEVTETDTETDPEDEEAPPEQPPGEGEVEPPPDQDGDEGEDGGSGGGEDTDGDSGTGGIEG
jgi:hypothetical protein